MKGNEEIKPIYNCFCNKNMEVCNVLPKHVYKFEIFNGSTPKNNS